MRALVAAALLAAAWPAQAARLDCRAVRAVSNGDGRNFADLNFEAQPRARLQLRVGRGRGVVANAETCESSIDEGSSDMECEWAFPDYVAAAGFYDGLIDRLRVCLGQAIPEAEAEAPEGEQAQAVQRQLRANEAEFTLAQWQTQLSLSLTEDPQEAAVRYLVKLGAETSRAEPEEEEDEPAD
jgi:hypothetical protein